MATLNTGIVALNSAGLQSGANAVFCVLGMPRGGTTLAARLLEAAGVAMGENLPLTAEDPEFVRLLREPSPDAQAFKRLVTARLEKHKRWGFKAPFRYHWNLLAEITDVRYLVVFRDVLAVANRNRISVAADLLTSMRANLALETRLLQFLSKSPRPSLLFSYEKALLFPREISEAILTFAGNGTSTAAVERLCRIIRPNEAEYVASQDPVKTIFHVDLFRRDRIAGWARRSNGKQVTIRIEINERPIAETLCSLPRVDLAKLFGGEGRFAFNVKIPTETSLPLSSAVTIRDASDGRMLFRETLG